MFPHNLNTGGSNSGNFSEILTGENQDNNQCTGDNLFAKTEFVMYLCNSKLKEKTIHEETIITNGGDGCYGYPRNC